MQTQNQSPHSTQNYLDTSPSQIVASTCLHAYQYLHRTPTDSDNQEAMYNRKGLQGHHGVLSSSPVSPLLKCIFLDHFLEYQTVWQRLTYRKVLSKIVFRKQQR